MPPNHKSDPKVPNKGQGIKLWEIQTVVSEAATAPERPGRGFPGVQRLRFHAPRAEGPGSVPGRGTRARVPSKSPRVAIKFWCGQINK